MTAAEFKRKWSRYQGKETSAYQEGFGKPHAHTGLAIRKLDKHPYECRTGVAWPLVFEAHKGALTFDFAGDHNGVQNYLRGKRWSGISGCPSMAVG